MLAVWKVVRKLTYQHVQSMELRIAPINIPFLISNSNVNLERKSYIIRKGLGTRGCTISKNSMNCILAKEQTFTAEINF